MECNHIILGQEDGELVDVHASISHVRGRRDKVVFDGLGCVVNLPARNVDRSVGYDLSTEPIPAGLRHLVIIRRRLPT